ncbi:MAG: FAD-binding oxidoreductase [Methanomassiliicoccales archaeon]|jgi:FAD/FMN-containing dehydrogenase
MKGALSIKGKVITDERQLERYGSDLSHYYMRPGLVAIPLDEHDVLDAVNFAADSGITITPRGAGSNLSGSAVGEGLVILTREMDHFIGKDGSIYACQSGMVFNELDKQARTDGFFIPYDPSSRAFCTIGGNVGTRASGIRSLKYGSTDNCLDSIRFVNPLFGLVDTAKELPHELKLALDDISARFREDEEMVLLLESRAGLKSSSGYNLGAFLEEKDANRVTTHLMVGSVGTLAVFTEIRLKLRPVHKEKVLYLSFFDSLPDAVRKMLPARAFGPSAFELLDSFGVNNMSILVPAPPEAKAVIMLEFDEALDEAGSKMTTLLKSTGSKNMVFRDQALIEKIWAVRESNLLRLKHALERPELKFLSFIDDLAVHPERLPDLIEKLDSIFRDERVQVIMYGHVGEGNLHVRPYIHREGWEELTKRLADKCFRAVLENDGTITGEHGMGRNRSKYLCEEWGKRACAYFQEIKQMFDPEGLLNPGVVFTESDLTEHLRF